jgi:hypothetical protein
VRTAWKPSLQWRDRFRPVLFPLPPGSWRVAETFSAQAEPPITSEAGTEWTFADSFEAVVFHLKAAS